MDRPLDERHDSRMGLFIEFKIAGLVGRLPFATPIKVKEGRGTYALRSFLLARHLPRDLASCLMHCWKLAFLCWISG